MSPSPKLEAIASPITIHSNTETYNIQDNSSLNCGIVVVMKSPSRVRAVTCFTSQGKSIHFSLQWSSWSKRLGWFCLWIHFKRLHLGDEKSTPRGISQDIDSKYTEHHKRQPEKRRSWCFCGLHSFGSLMLTTIEAQKIVLLDAWGQISWNSRRRGTRKDLLFFPDLLVCPLLNVWWRR